LAAKNGEVSGIIGSNREELNNGFSLAKDNCDKPAWHVPKFSVKIEEIRKCGSGLNR
jgi:hypothetical protein